MKTVCWTSLLFLVFSGCSQRMQPVRVELACKQNENGLTLAWFDRSIHKVKFAERTFIQERAQFPDAILGGVISPDGAEVAADYSTKSESGLLIGQQNGTERRLYPNRVVAGLSWSQDKTKLAMTADNRNRWTTPPNPRLIVWNPASGEEIEVDVRASVTSQCWSPDGNSIAFLDDGTFYTISPKGDTRRELFKDRGAVSGLWWSPDCRFVAFLSRNRKSEPVQILDVGPVRLRVRRLRDGSEDWLLQLYDVSMPSFQWIEDASLKKR
jgi:WD40 repeat protein